MTKNNKEKILLALLPFWTPQIPPMGISCLKSFLQSHGFAVKAVDANPEDRLRAIYNNYFDALRESVSENKRGNFYNIGHDVLQNHLMAHLHYTGEKEYVKLVKTLVFKTFYCELADERVYRLNEIIARFYNWLEAYFVNLLEREKPTVLGLSAYRGNAAASMFCFKLTREKYPHIKNVMGGAVFAQALAPGTPDFRFFLEKTRAYIDTIIIGEGENLFLKLLKDELPQSRRVFTLDDNNRETLDLSCAAVPDFSDFNLGYYPNLAAYTSRSCPFQCTFCTETIYWGNYRKKNAGQIVEELKKLYKQHGTQVFLMCDSLLNPVIAGLASEFIKTELSLYWDGYLRVDKHSCDIDNALLWRRGGFYRARLGVESGSQRILDAMDKKITIQQIKSSLAALAGAGIKTTTYWIIGYPGETEADFQQTLDLIEEMKDNIYEAECNPFGYYLTGQVNSDKWSGKKESMLLYPEEAREMLIMQTWILNARPSREETYQRIARFVEHCIGLGIANPYSLYDISKADERWKKLHKNAVPSLIEFNDRGAYIAECKHVKKYRFAEKSIKEDLIFGF